MSVLLVAGSLWASLAYGSSLGIFATASGTSFVDRIEVIAGGSAAEAGLRSGDLGDLRPLSPAERYRWRHRLIFAEVMTLAVSRNGTVQVVRLLATHRNAFRWDTWAAFSGILWLVLFAALLA